MLDNGKVSAYNTKSFVFLREKSVGDPTMDNITTVNIPAWVSHELKVLDSCRKVDIQVGESLTYALFPSAAFCRSHSAYIHFHLSCAHLITQGRNEQAEGELLEGVHGVHLDELFRDRSLHHSHCGRTVVGL